MDQRPLSRLVANATKAASPSESKDFSLVANATKTAEPPKPSPAPQPPAQTDKEKALEAKQSRERAITITTEGLMGAVP